MCLQADACICFLTACFGHAACKGTGIFYNWKVCFSCGSVLYMAHVVSGYKNTVYSQI